MCNCNQRGQPLKFIPGWVSRILLSWLRSVLNTAARLSLWREVLPKHPIAGISIMAEGAKKNQILLMCASRRLHGLTVQHPHILLASSIERHRLSHSPVYWGHELTCSRHTLQNSLAIVIFLLWSSEPGTLPLLLISCVLSPFKIELFCKSYST